MLSAALRHVRDAETLLQTSEFPKSPDQAWHLAGFGAECLRKACLDDSLLYQALGHDLGAKTEPLVEWGISLDPHAWRYKLASWCTRLPNLAEWQPAHRYERTGTRTSAVVASFVAEITQLVDSTFADLWADGRLSESEL